MEHNSAFGKCHFLFLPALLLSILCSSCMSVIRDRDTSITINTVPPQAVVNYNGTQAITPTVIRVPRYNSGILTITKDGYVPLTMKIDSHSNGWAWTGSILLNATHGILTLGITLVIGVGVDIANGVLSDVSPENVNVALTPLNEPDKKSVKR